MKQIYTFRVSSRNVDDSLTDPLTTPGVNLSCFGAGRDIGDNGPLISSARCFNDREHSCKFHLKIQCYINEWKIKFVNFLGGQNTIINQC